MWRRMTSADLAGAGKVADVVHADAFPEDAAVFAERLKLYPQGCWILEKDAAIVGYILSHPWHDTPPALNTLLKALPEKPTTYYIHDLALLPSARGSGAGAVIARQTLEQARQAGFTQASLVSVHGSAPFWQRFGFQRIDDAKLRSKLESYHDADAALMRVRL